MKPLNIVPPSQGTGSQGTDGRGAGQMPVGGHGAGAAAGGQPKMAGRYDERMVAPMRAELTRLGFAEARTAAEVDAAVVGDDGATLVVVNSICGCAAGRARPGVALALQRTPTRPDRMVTVFAGNDVEATARAREYFTGYPPSSPQMALLKDGQLLWMLERREIEGRDAPEIAADIVAALERFCRAE